MKRCTKCGLDKENSDFYKDKQKKDGLKSFCKCCASVNDEDYYERNKEKILAAVAEKRRLNGAALDIPRMGISVDQYNDMLEAQNWVCAICGEDETVMLKGKLRRLVIDHDRSCCNKDRGLCGKCVRGILCARCNVGLGYFRDNSEYLRKAIDYLDKNRRS
ncbi:HNH endonuclease [Streptomyces phage Daubenski]|jgi:hypothetical protein|uniref:HNH endonuclease n=1 Tax=Streptomyces phage Daubenski TaxID=2653725 RepID=A0A5Q2WIG2_9CAUD|nr:endonuclease VII [Streptomyces phage Daubenski]QGH76337.1 HNH endonuclease [Streptomyces phage Daubenski]